MALLDNGLESLTPSDKTRNYLIGGDVSVPTTASTLAAMLVNIAAATVVLSPKVADLEAVEDFAIGSLGAEQQVNISVVAYHSALTNTIVYASVPGAVVLASETPKYPTLDELQTALPNALPGKILRIGGVKASSVGGALVVLRDGAHRGLGVDEGEKDTSGSYAPDITAP